MRRGALARVGKEEGQRDRDQDLDALCGHTHTGCFLGTYFTAGQLNSPLN